MTRRLLHAVAAVWLCAWAAAALAADPDWPVKDAVLRFEVEMTVPPSDPVAGVLAIIPDGGILPRPAPSVTVQDSAGRELKSETVWCNPGQGLGVVFEPPGGNRAATVYLSPKSQSSALLTTAGGKFKPGLFLYTHSGDASLEAAERIPAGFWTGSNAVMGAVDTIGQMENPFGADDEYISYYTGWIKVPKAGRYFFCTISDDGSQCRVDGNVVASWPGIHPVQAGRKGEFGNNVDLSAGFHRVEYFHFKKEGQPQTQLCWRPPGQAAGGLPATVPASAYLHSGKAVIRRGETRGGVPPAVFTARCVGYLWLGEKPLNLFMLEAPLVREDATDVSLSWHLGPGLDARGRLVMWLFEGGAPRPVGLTVTANGGSSKATRTVEIETPPPAASLNSAYARRQFRDALLARCRAVAASERPCAGWNSDLWSLLAAVSEPYRGRALMTEIFERSRMDVMMQPEKDRHLLEDIFFDAVRYSDKAKALAWLDRLEQEDKDRERKYHWQLARIDFQLYEMENADKAKELAADLQAKAGGSDAGILALVRLGDVERLKGNYEEATKLYTRAQDMPRRAPAPSASGQAARPSAHLARNKEELEARRQGGAPAKGPGSGEPTKLETTREPWKAEAVRASSYYATAHDLIRKGFMAEAEDVLREWEIESPLSKLSGDYPLAEAEFFIAVRDYSRALRVLQAYRKGVEMTPFLPTAMEMELECLGKLGRANELKDLAELAVKRFPGLPLAQKAKSLLRGGTAPAAGSEQPADTGADAD